MSPGGRLRIHGVVETQERRGELLRSLAALSGNSAVEVALGLGSADQATEEVYIDYDDDGKINLSGVPKCFANLEPLTTAQAVAACTAVVVPRSRANTGSGRRTSGHGAERWVGMEAGEGREDRHDEREVLRRPLVVDAVNATRGLVPVIDGVEVRSAPGEGTTFAVELPTAAGT